VRRNRERGSTLVEAALILILALALLIGVLDLGQMMFIHQTVAERTRAAARWGAVNPYDASKVSNMVLYGSITANPGSELFNITPSHVAVAHNALGTTDDRIDVTVSGYSYSFFSAAIVNSFYGAGGASANRTGLTVHVSVPYEYVP
jgi:hypothetical protein